jgi:hypothetical protein
MDTEKNTPNEHKPAPKQLEPGEGETLTLLGEPRVIKVLPSENNGLTCSSRHRTLPERRFPFMLTRTRTRHSTFSPVSSNSWSKPKKWPLQQAHSYSRRGALFTASPSSAGILKAPHHCLTRDST